MRNLRKSSLICYYNAGLVIVLALGMGMFPLASLANSKRIVYTFEMKVRLSDVIIFGEIKEINRKWLFFREAIVEPLSVLKGKVDAPRINVKIENIYVDVGKKYFLFLITDGSTYKVAGGDLGIYYVLDNGYVRHVNAKYTNADILPMDVFTLKIKDQRDW